MPKLDDQIKKLDELDQALGRIIGGKLRAIIFLASGALALLAWGAYQLYGLNREVGEMKVTVRADSVNIEDLKTAASGIARTVDTVRAIADSALAEIRQLNVPRRRPAAQRPGPIT